jgi:hypothetical protein
VRGVQGNLPSVSCPLADARGSEGCFLNRDHKGAAPAFLYSYENKLLQEGSRYCQRCVV